MAGLALLIWTTTIALAQTAIKYQVEFTESVREFKKLADPQQIKIVPPLELFDFKPRKKVQHFKASIDQNNDLTQVTQILEDNGRPEWMTPSRYMVMNKFGVQSYGAENKLLLNMALSAQEQAEWITHQNLIASDPNFTWFNFRIPTDSDMQAMRQEGYTVERVNDNITITGFGEQTIINTKALSVQNKITEEGILKKETLDLYVRQNGFLVPGVRIERKHLKTTNGVCYQEVRETNFSNFREIRL